MVGINAYATALPSLRLPASAYVEAWGSCSARGMEQKAFCAYDEDAVTLAISAARAVFEGYSSDVLVDALFLGVTTPPYDEKPSAATIPTALFKHSGIRVTEITGSPQAGVQALVSALEFCAANKGRYALAIAADAPEAPVDASYEHALGAAAAAFLVGPNGPAAEFLETYAVTRETFGARFRRRGEKVLSDLELRTQDNFKSLRMLAETSKLPKIKHIAVGADAALMRSASRALGQPDAIFDGIWSQIGDAGAASAPFALAAALDVARSGDTILTIGVGAGATAARFMAGRELAKTRRRGVKTANRMAMGRTVNYVTYLKHRRMLSSRNGAAG